MAYSRRAVATAHALLPHLVAAAQAGATGTYTTFAERLGNVRLRRALTYPLGYIRDECHERGYPHLTAIVVTGRPPMPGDEFLPEETAHMSREEKRVFYARLQAEVFACTGWGRLLADLGLEPASPWDA